MSETTSTFWLGPARTRILSYGAAVLLGTLAASLIFFVPPDYLLFLVGGLIFLYLLVARIEVAIILALFVQNLLARFNYMGQGTPFHPNGFMGGAIVGGALLYFAFNKVPISGFRRVGFFLLFFLVCIFSTLTVAREYLMSSLTMTLRLATALSIFAVLLFKLRSIQETKWILAAVVTAQILPTISSLMLAAGSTGLSFTSETLRLGDSGVGITIAIMLTLCLVFLLDAKTTLWRVLWGGLVALFGLGLFFSFGRSAWISFVVVLLLLGLLRHKWLLILAPLALVLAFMLIAGISERFSDISLTSLGSGSSTLASRIELWRAAYDIFRSHPVLGVGIGAGASMVGAYLHQYSWMIHNDYLSVLLETGFFGMAFFLAWHWQWLVSIVTVYKGAQQNYDKTFTLAVLAVWVLSLVARFSDNMLLDSYDMYPLCALAAAAMALPRIRAAMENAGE